MASLIILAAVLWLVHKYAPYGDKIIAVVITAVLLKWLGILPFMF